ncbi:hypothetical protein ACFOWE_08830 [Planomonospora corallina]|uniref:Uncharacterized protein n=1 Tax=Planomonospora corallina TaxID=1806052 RepID=A0ABV8I2N1_9ACTN
MIALDAFDPNDVTPGLLGFLVVAAIGFALFLLVKSMRKQISKIDLPDESKPGEKTDKKPDGAAQSK